jgi:hypothetical protein
MLSAICLSGCGGLSDAEKVWCEENYVAVIAAANRLNIHAPTKFDQILDTDPSADPAFATTGEPSDAWASDASAVRACKAAYEAR